MQKATDVPAPLVEATDHTLIQHILSGNTDAFTILMDRYHPLLHRFAYHCLGEYDQACDVVQHVFLQLYLSLPHLIADKQLKPWLLRVTQNSCRDELRKRKRRRVTVFSALEMQMGEEDLSPLATLPDQKPLPDEVAEFNELQHTLLDAIECLPARFRLIVLLRYFHQYSFAEIGQLLNIPMTTAKTYYYRACSRLRTTLKPHTR